MYATVYRAANRMKMNGTIPHSMTLVVIVISVVKADYCSAFTVYSFDCVIKCATYAIPIMLPHWSALYFAQRGVFHLQKHATHEYLVYFARIKRPSVYTLQQQFLRRQPMLSVSSPCYQLKTTFFMLKFNSSQYSSRWLCILGGIRETKPIYSSIKNHTELMKR